MPDCARLHKPVFDIDLEHCPQCGCDLKIIASIEDPAVIVRILTHLGLPARAQRRGCWRCSRRPDPQDKSGSATALTIPRGPRSRDAVTLRRIQPSGAMQSPKNHASGELAPYTARLTACRAGDIFAGSQKKRLNFLFASMMNGTPRAKPTLER